MRVDLEKVALESSKVDNKQNIKLVKQEKNNEEQINLNKKESLIKSGINSNEIKIEEKDFIKSENKESTNADKYSINSDLLNKKNIIEKKEENSEHLLNLKTLVKSQYILKKILLFLDEKEN